MKTALPLTSVGKNSNVKDYAKAAKTFLLDNVNFITFAHDEQKKLLQTHDAMLRTVMSELYQQAIVEEKLEIFTLLNLSKVTKIPSWFLISWLDIDILELKELDRHSYDVLNSISAYRDKIIVDITPYYSEKKGAIVDTTNFYSRMVRNMLCRSYHLSGKLWLTPQLIYYLAKFYATILSTKIGKVYNLTYQEQHIAATALAIYFVNQCSDIPDLINPMMGKMDFIHRVVDTKPIYQYISEKYTLETYNLQAVVDTIVALGPARMSQFNLSTFLTMTANLTSNQLVSLIALEYPPYWCHLILSALSGDKTNLYHTIKLLNMRKETLEFQAEILRTNSFIKSLS